TVIRLSAAAVSWAIRGRGAALTSSISESRTVSLLQATADDRGRQSSIPVRRTWTPVSRCSRRNCDDKRRSLSSDCCRGSAAAERAFATRDHDLSAPEHRRVCGKAGGEDARRSEGLLFCQFGL